MNETKPTSAISDYQSPSGITTALRWYTDGATVAAAGVDVGSAPASSYTYTAYYVPPTEVAVTTLPTVTSSVTVNIATITVVASSEVAITRIDLSSSVVQEDTYTWSQVLTDAAGFPGDDIADYWISVASAAIASWPVYAELYNMAQDYSSTVCPSSFTCNMGRWGTVTMPYDESGMTTALQLLKWAWYTWSLYVCFFLIMRGL